MEYEVNGIRHALHSRLQGRTQAEQHLRPRPECPNTAGCYLGGIWELGEVGAANVRIEPTQASIDRTAILLASPLTV